MASGVVRKRTRVRRNGQIAVSWFVDYYDQNRKRRNRTFATKGAADDWLAEMRIEVKTGVHTPDAHSITVKEAAALWLHNCKLDQLERGTLRIYDQYVRLHIAPLLGPKKLSRLTTPDVVAFAKALLPRVSRQRARKVLSTLKLILADMQRSGLVAQNVTLPVKIKLSDRDARRLQVGVDVPSKAEIASLLRQANGRARTRLLIAALAGLRASESRALCWGDIDFGERMLRVRRGRTGGGRSARSRPRTGVATSRCRRCWSTL